MPPSPETLHHFLNTSPAVLYEYLQHQDGSGEVQYISPNCEELLGVAKEKLLGNVESFFNLLHPEEKDDFIAADVSSVNDESFFKETRIVLPSGEVKFVQISSRPSFRTEHDDVVWIGCLIDITPLRLAQEEIKTLRGIIPICQHCKEIRDDAGCWNKLEQYISEHSEAVFTHGICDKCMEKNYPKVRKTK